MMPRILTGRDRLAFQIEPLPPSKLEQLAATNNKNRVQAAASQYYRAERDSCSI
jgi:hypothetical protein